MSIKLRCPACSTPHNLADKLAGMRIRCKSCKAIVAVPRAETPAAPDAGTASTRTPAPAAAALVRKESDVPTPRPQPQPPPKKRRFGCVVVAAAAVLLLAIIVGGGAAAWLLFLAPVSPEEHLIGQWHIDRDPTKRTGVPPAALVLEFQPDGTGSFGVYGDPKPGTWKMRDKKGSTITLEIQNADLKEPMPLRVTPKGKDRLAVVFVLLQSSCEMVRGPAPGSDAPTLEAREIIDCPAVNALAMTKDGQLAAVKGHGTDDNLQIWDLGKKALLRSFTSRGGSDALAFSPDGKWLASRETDGFVLRDLQTGSVARTLRPKAGGMGFCLDIHFSPQADLVVACPNRTTVYGWDPHTGSVTLSWPVNASDSVTRVSPFFEGGTRIATGHQKGGVKIWNVATGKVEQDFPVLNEISVTALAVSADAKRIAAWSSPGPIRIWDLTGNTPMRTIAVDDLSQQRNVQAICFLPDNKTLLCPGRQYNLLAVDVTTGTIRAVLKGYASRDSSLSLALSGDGAVLLSAAGGPGFKVWDLTKLP